MSVRDDTKNCEKISILNSFRIRGREGAILGVKFKIANFSLLFT